MQKYKNILTRLTSWWTFVRFLAIPLLATEASTWFMNSYSWLLGLECWREEVPVRSKIIGGAPIVGLFDSFLFETSQDHLLLVEFTLFWSDSKKHQVGPRLKFSNCFDVDTGTCTNRCKTSVGEHISFIALDVAEPLFREAFLLDAQSTIP